MERGARPADVGFTGITDARFYINDADIPTIILGPGSLTVAHTANEWVLVDDLVAAARIYARIFVGFLGATGRVERRMERFDVFVIGGGGTGSEVAFRLSAHGMRVAIAERDKLGGECNHYGCVPTKVMLRSAKIAALARDAAGSACGSRR